MTSLAKKLMLTAMAATVMLGGCTSSETPSTTDVPSTTATTTAATSIKEETFPTVSWEDSDRMTDATDAVTVTLSDGGITADADGVTVNGDVVTFTKGGAYLLMGQLSNGQLCVDASDTVHLILGGVSVHSDASAPLYIKQADKVVLTMMDGTENIFSDSASLVFDDAEKEEPSAALFSKADLTINGGGKLTVNASFRDGIVSRDGLKIADGVVNVTATDDALMGRDYVLVGGGELMLQAGGDGVKSTNDAGPAVGLVTIEGGVLNIVSGSDGIQSESSLTVTDGVVNVTSGGGSEAAPPHAKEAFGWGREEATEEDVAGKGLKAQTSLMIGGGEIYVDAADDALHSNRKLAIKGGVITAASGDDGVHADEEISVSDGTLTVTTSYEGLEAKQIVLDGGCVSLTASDDGVNASSGTTSSRDPMASDGSSFVINGGTLYVDAQGDGLDSNATIRMSGGLVSVIGPLGGANGTLDFNGSFLLEGGTLIAMGSSSMAQTPSLNGQNGIVWGGFSAQSGDTLTLADEDGKVLASLSATRAVNWAYLSCDALRVGETVTVSCGNYSEIVTVKEGENRIGNADAGGFGGGFGGGHPGGRPDGDFTPPGRPEGTPPEFPDGGRPF